MGVGLNTPTDLTKEGGFDFWAIFKPLKRQLEFLKKASKHRYMLYGGARGGGKSRLLRWGLLYRLIVWAIAGHKGVRVGLFSEDYPTLRDRQITKIKAEFPSWLGKLKSTQDEGLGFFLFDIFGGGAILLRNLDKPEKYQSVELAGIAVEELTKNPDVSIFDVLRGSLRWPGITDTFFWGATNPGSAGHLWVKALWIDRDYTGEYERLAPLAHEFCFVQSLPKDNHHLTKEYWDELNSLTEVLRLAWVEGSWDHFVGMALTEWLREAHVAEYEPEVGPDKGLYRWTAGGDWGYTAQGCLYLMATGPERSLIRHEFLFREMDPFSVGHMWGQVLMRFPRPEWTAIDTPAVSDGGPTILEKLQAGMNAAVKKFPVPFINPPKGPGSRVTKLQLLHDYLKIKMVKDDEGVWRPMRDANGLIPTWALPQLQIHPSCTYLIRTLPALPLDPTNSEDVDTDSDDHGYDGITSWLMSRTPAVERKKGPPAHPDDHPGREMVGKPRGGQLEWPGEEEQARWTRVPEDV